MPASPQISAVVANTGPIIALWLGEQITLLPKVLKSLHVPKEEVLEWKNTVAKLQNSRATTPSLDVNSLIDQWTASRFLIQYDLSDSQIHRAERLNQKIHPGTSTVHLVDGYAVSLAQTLTDLGTVQALLADERSLRNVAKGEGLNVVGSLWVIRLLYESNEIDLPTASAFPDIVAKRGQHYSRSLITQFRASLTQAR